MGADLVPRHGAVGPRACLGRRHLAARMPRAPSPAGHRARAAAPARHDPRAARRAPRLARAPGRAAEAARRPRASAGRERLLRRPRAALRRPRPRAHLPHPRRPAPRRAGAGRARGRRPGACRGRRHPRAADAAGAVPRRAGGDPRPQAAARRAARAAPLRPLGSVGRAPPHACPATRRPAGAPAHARVPHRRQQAARGPDGRAG